MSRAMALLEEAYEIGTRELALILEGEVEEAGLLAQERDAKIARAIKERDPEDDKAALLECLDRNSSLHERIMLETRKLHEELRERLQRSKSETRRLAGYQNGATMRSRIPNKYLNKQG